MRADLFGPGAKLHHVGVAVRSITAAGVGDVTVTHDPTQKVRVAFVNVGDARLELVEPAGDDSPINASLSKGNRLLHLCYEVSDLPAAMAAAGAHRFRTVAEPVPAVAFDGQPIAWVYHPVWGLIELLQAD